MATDVHLTEMSSAVVLSSSTFGSSAAAMRSLRWASVGTSGSTTGSLTIEDVIFSGEHVGPGLLIAGSHDATVQLTRMQWHQLDGGTTCPAVADLAESSVTVVMGP